MSESNNNPITVFRTYSKMEIARIFSVNRATVYSWECQGCPMRPPVRHGRPARLNFEEVLEWFLAREDIRGVSDQGLKILERTIRERKEKIYG